MNIGAFLVLLDLVEELPSIFSTAEPDKFVLPTYTPPQTKKIGVETPPPLSDITFDIYGSLLPEDFELVGPSRLGLRPKGL